MEHPLGLPHLGPNERKRVEIANELFRYTCQLFAFCVKRGVLATMENPRGSYLWVYSFFAGVTTDLLVVCNRFSSLHVWP